jgi:hypothetical protein
MHAVELHLVPVGNAKHDAHHRTARARRDVADRHAGLDLIAALKLVDFHWVHLLRTEAFDLQSEYLRSAASQAIKPLPAGKIYVPNRIRNGP